MSAPTVDDLKAGLSTRMATIASLAGRSTPFQPASINPPCSWVWLPEIPQYHGTMRMGVIEYLFPVYVVVGSQSDRAAQSAMSGYLSPAGPSSVLVAIEGDQTLGGLEAKATVVGFRPTTIEEAATLHAIGGVWTVHITAAGA